jgi:hypothetical protein
VREEPPGDAIGSGHVTADVDDVQTAVGTQDPKDLDRRCGPRIAALVENVG